MLTNHLTKKINILLLCLLTLTGALFFDAADAEAKIKRNYDLIVVGSDPEGIAAAISGARNDLDVLLVDTRPQVGGLMTRGWLNTIDMNYAYNPYGPKYDFLNKGIFAEFYRQVEGDSFDVLTAQTVFDNMLAAEDDLDLLLDVQAVTPLVKKSGSKKVIEGVEVQERGGDTDKYYADRVIDATQDADIAAAAGVPYSVGMADAGYPDRKMAVTQVFRLEGLSDEDWMTIRVALNTDDSRDTGANSVSAWGFGGIMERYQSTNSRVGIRGLNIGRQNDGSVLINALHIYNVDPSDSNAVEEAKQLAERELPHVVDFIRQNVPGFANAVLGGVAPELYVRETRHIYAEYRLTIDDVLENRDFDDRIAFGSYPVDVQATGPDKKGYIIGNPIQYAVPFRSIVPKEVDNLLVVGRSAGFDSLAHGSARVIPTGMAAGEAAGAAAALSIEKDITFREMAGKSGVISELQKILNKQGMELEPFSFKNPLADHWAYEDMKFVRRYGIARGGYTNDYKLDEIMPVTAFIEAMKDLAVVYNLPAPEVEEEDLPDEPKADEEYAEEVLPEEYASDGADLFDIEYLFGAEDEAAEDEEEEPLTAEYAEEVLTQYDKKLAEKYWEDRVLDSIEENDGCVTYGAAYALMRQFAETVK